MTSGAREFIHGRCWPSKAELRTEVFEYIEVFFNPRRRHATPRHSLAHTVLGILSPTQFEDETNTESEKITTTAAAVA